MAQSIDDILEEKYKKKSLMFSNLSKKKTNLRLCFLIITMMKRML